MQEYELAAADQADLEVSILLNWYLRLNIFFF